MRHIPEKKIIKTAMDAAADRVIPLFRERGRTLMSDETRG